MVPSWNICSCCGCEFGYEDRQESSMLAYRERWLSSGATWFEPKCKPAAWSLEAQLALIPTVIPAGVRRLAIAQPAVQVDGTEAGH
jgi:hypothetical protein